MAAVDPNDDASRLAPPLVPALVQLAETRGMKPASDAAMVAPLLDRAAALLASLVRMDRLGSG